MEILDVIMYCYILQCFYRCSCNLIKRAWLIYNKKPEPLKIVVMGTVPENIINEFIDL